MHCSRVKTSEYSPWRHQPLAQLATGPAVVMWLARPRPYASQTLLQVCGLHAERIAPQPGHCASTLSAHTPSMAALCCLRVASRCELNVGSQPPRKPCCAKCRVSVVTHVSRESILPITTLPTPLTQSRRQRHETAAGRQAGAPPHNSHPQHTRTVSSRQQHGQRAAHEHMIT